MKPSFVHCGCCECYHPADWYGDCRDDNNRFTLTELDDKYGEYGWNEIQVFTSSGTWTNPGGVEESEEN